MLPTNKRRVTRSLRRRKTTTAIRGVQGTTTIIKRAVDKETRGAVKGVYPTVEEKARTTTIAAIPTTD